jgi:hypothetical protein
MYSLKTDLVFLSPLGQLLLMKEPWGLKVRNSDSKRRNSNPSYSGDRIGRITAQGKPGPKKTGGETLFQKTS